MKDKTHTSLELSKKLAESGCKLESKDCWMQFTDKSYGVIYNDKELCNKGLAYDILNDICCKYAKEFWGDKSVCFYCGGDSFDIDNAGSGVYCNNCDHEEYLIPIYRFRTRKILKLMQRGEKQEAEDYIWKHCKFNPDNKEK